MNLTPLTQQAIDLLSQMINISSYSREEDKVADFLFQALNNKGIAVRRELNNIFIFPEIDENKPNVLLNAHIDTVKPSDSWTKNPHSALMEGGCLYGLGSNDDGASVVSLLMAYLELTKKEQPYNLIFLASAEEEISGKNGVEYALKFLPKIDFAIVGEPTGMQPAIAEKGLMVIDAEAKGKSGHAAREEGINAIYKALKDIEWINTYQFPKVSDLLGAVKMSVTVIQGGERHNVVPDTCHYVIDIRSNEKYSNQEIFDIINEHTAAEIKARSYRLNSSFTNKNHPFLLKVMEKGLQPYGSPTLSDQCLMNFSSIKMGPGQSARSHSADEFIKISEIQEAIELYIELLDGLVL